jgi:hypothetical protein
LVSGWGWAFASASNSCIGLVWFLMGLLTSFLRGFVCGYLSVYYYPSVFSFAGRCSRCVLCLPGPDLL